MNSRPTLAADRSRLRDHPTAQPLFRAKPQGAFQRSRVPCMMDIVNPVDSGPQAVIAIYEHARIGPTSHHAASDPASGKIQQRSSQQIRLRGPRTQYEWSPADAAPAQRPRYNRQCGPAFPAPLGIAPSAIFALSIPPWPWNPPATKTQGGEACRPAASRAADWELRCVFCRSCRFQDRHYFAPPLLCLRTVFPNVHLRSQDRTTAARALAPPAPTALAVPAIGSSDPALPPDCPAGFRLRQESARIIENFQRAAHGRGHHGKTRPKRFHKHDAEWFWTLIGLAENVRAGQQLRDIGTLSQKTDAIRDT